MNVQHLELLIKENYPSVRLQMSHQPVDFISSAVKITTDSIEGWTIIPSKKPTVCEPALGSAVGVGKINYAGIILRI